jgi:hypothetical protein
MKIIEARSEEVIQKWKNFFGEARYASYEPTGAVAQTESFCPCQKTGGNTAFLPVFFFHVLYGCGIHTGSDSGFSPPFAPVRNRFHPLQHPKRTQFCLFGSIWVRFLVFLSFGYAKFSGCFLRKLPHYHYRIKSLLIPSRQNPYSFSNAIYLPYLLFLE